MTTVAQILVLVATFAASYVAKLLIFDVAWRDHRVHRSSATSRILGISIAIGVGLVAIPFGLGEWLLASGHPIGAIVVAVGSLALSAAGFVVIASAMGR